VAVSARDRQAEKVARLEAEKKRLEQELARARGPCSTY
jgi:hypothetical protein